MKALFSRESIAYALLVVLGWARAGSHNLTQSAWLASALFVETREKLKVLKGRKTSFPDLTCSAVAQSVLVFLYRADLSLRVETQSDV